MRTPQEIAAEARAKIDRANKAFVPPPLAQLAELYVEFMESAAEQLGAITGTKPAEAGAAPTPAL